MKNYRLENLSCAHCAAQMEDTLRRTPGVHAVELRFATLELRIDTDDLDTVRSVVRSIEPEVRVVDPAASSENEKTPTRRPRWLLLSTETILWLVLLIVAETGADGHSLLTALTAGLFLLTAWPVLAQAFQHLKSKNWINETTLMAIAGVAAWGVGAGLEALAVIVFYRWGEWLQGRASAGARRHLGALLSQKSTQVRVLVPTGTESRDPRDVAPGTEYEVMAGEIVPLDGRLIEGAGTLDTSALTGESFPRSVEVGMEVLAGYRNGDHVLKLVSVRPFAESSWAKIVESVDEALSRKAPLERFVTRFSRWYTPTVLVLSLVLFLVLWGIGISADQALYRSLVLLVVSCPCALLLSIPLTYLGALGVASRRGILIRDAGALDRLASVHSVAFDKTGTLTEGHPALVRVVDAGNAELLKECLDLGLSASSHPLSRAWASKRSAPAGAKEVQGGGVSFDWKGSRWGVGRLSFLKTEGFVGLPENSSDALTTVHAAGPNGYLGKAEFEDLGKMEVPEALERLRKLGLSPLVVLSGDNRQVVERWATTWSLDEAHGELLPEDKLKWMDAWESGGHRTLYVGDGLNDAPVLARATVGVGLGAGAHSAVLETADVAALDGSPLQIPRLIQLGRRTRKILFQNIVLALGVKALFMVLGAEGIAGLWEAVFADSGVALLAVANSLRISRRLD